MLGSGIIRGQSPFPPGKGSDPGRRVRKARDPLLLFLLQFRAGRARNLSVALRILPHTARGSAVGRTPYSGRAGSTNPYWLAIRASAMLSWIPIFSNNRALCVFTVFALRLRRRAMSS